MNLIAALIAISCVSSVKIEKMFHLTYAKAVKTLAADTKIIERECAKFGIQDKLVRSIVFPEYIRNNEFAGFIEQKAVETAYLQYGSDAIDFSIGAFQIKPSFAKKVEEVLEQTPELRKKYAQLRYTGNTHKQEEIRIARLKSVVWQTRYVCCYIEYCEKTYALTTKHKAEKVKYLALLYNMGFPKNRETVEKNFTNKWFPYGPKYQIEQLSYWEVALDYYIKYT